MFFSIQNSNSNLQIVNILKHAKKYKKYKLSISLSFHLFP